MSDVKNAVNPLICDARARKAKACTYIIVLAVWRMWNENTKLRHPCDDCEKRKYYENEQRNKMQITPPS